MNNDYEIYIGSKENPTYYFDNDTIMELSGENTVNMIMDELSIDTLTFTVLYEFVESNVFKPTDYDAFESSEGEILCTYGNSNIVDIEWGTPVLFFNNAVQVSKYYIDTIKRVGIKEYQIECVSIIGLLDRQTYYGKYIFPNTTYLSNLVKEIIGSDGIAKYAGYDSVYLYGESFLSTSDLTSTDAYFKIKIRYDGICEKLNESEETTAELLFLGFEIYGEQGKKIIVKSDISRESTSSNWSTPRLDLYYDTQIIQGINLAEGVDYEITVDCYNGKFIINDNQFSFSLVSGFNGSIGVAGKYIKYPSTSTVGGYGNWDGKVYWTEEKSLTNSAVHYIPVKRLADNYIGMASTTSPAGRMGVYSTTINNRINARYMAKLGEQISVPNLEFKLASQTELTILDDITFESEVDRVLVQGWIPICTRREALQQVLFAYAVNLIKDETGKLIFTWIYDSDETSSISDTEIFNSGDITYEDNINKISVTENTYIIDTSIGTEVVFDNTNGTEANNLLVQLKEPPYFPGTFGTTGTLKVIYVGTNFVIVSGLGSVKMLKCVHYTNDIYKVSNTTKAGSTISVSDVTMITPSTSESVLDRLYSYYSTKQKLTNDIIYSSQACGRQYSFHDKFMNNVNAYLYRTSIKASNILKAKCEYLLNYHPSGIGGSYSRAVLLTGDGTWTVPASVFAKQTPKIKVVLIGGGHGGSSGYAGESGNVSPTTDVEEITSGKGGSKGTAGTGGKVYQTTISGADLLSSFQYSCGDGGDGGVQCLSHTVANEGSDGGNSTFGSYSSASGVVIQSGITNFLNGVTYAKSPENIAYNSGWLYNRGLFADGQDGGTLSDGYYNSCSPWWLEDYGRYRLDVMNGMDDYEASQKNMYDDYNIRPSQYRVRFDLGGGAWTEIDGGFQGGAAIGNNGNQHEPTAPHWVIYHSTIQLGNGADGADAISPINIDEYAKVKNGRATPYGDTYYPYGFGGLGGNGGGGGGSSGCGNETFGLATCIAGTAGIGGKGSAGGKGAKGCIIVYY